MKTLIIPLIKKFLGLFLSMIFVSILAICLVTAFTSAVYNLKEGHNKYIKEYDNISYFISTDFKEKEEYKDLYNIDGIDSLTMRISLNCFYKRTDDSISSIKLISYKDNNESKKYVHKSVKKDINYSNVSIPKTFAKKNNINLNDKLNIGFLDSYISLNVYEIVDIPEASHVSYDNFIWMNNYDYGYFYLDNDDFAKAIYDLSNIIINKANKDIEYKNKLDNLSNLASYINLIAISINNANTFVNGYTNEILIHEKYDIYNELNNYLMDKGDYKIIKSSDLLYLNYYKNCISQMNLIAVFMPILFFSIAVVIVSLFIDQMIKTMRREIGILMAIGISKKDIMKLFIYYIFIMSIISIILSIISAIFLVRFITGEYIRVYSIPLISQNLNPLIALIISLIFIIVILLVTIISSLRILKITPKDALLSNNDKFKNNPKWINKILAKLRLNLALVINSIIKNKGRFIASVFAIFASFTIISFTLFFNIAEDRILDNTTYKRLNYDCQIYFEKELSIEEINSLKKEDYIKDIEIAYVSYVKIENGNKSLNVELIAKDSNLKNLSYIPNYNETKSLEVKENGIIIPTHVANQLNIKKGDIVSINNKEIEVTLLSSQYAKMASYISFNELDRLDIDYFMTLFINETDDIKLTNYLFMNYPNSIIKFSDSLKNEMVSDNSALKTLVYCLIIFSLAIGFILLSIMIQSKLIEDSRKISLFRINGFSIIDIFKMELYEKIIEFIIGVIFAIPTSIILSITAFKEASTKILWYRFILDYRVYLLTIAFVFGVIILSIIFNIIKIKKWNLATNTKMQE